MSTRDPLDDLAGLRERWSKDAHYARTPQDRDEALAKVALVDRAERAEAALRPPSYSTSTRGPAAAYVVGFLLDGLGRVALIQKNRPTWQAGRLNGIGGHIEPGETPDEAMRREFREETGTDLDGWQPFVLMRFPNAQITFYRRWADSAVLDGLHTATDETVTVINITGLGSVATIPNLAWLIPLAAYTADRYDLIEVEGTVAETLPAAAQQA